MMTKKITNLILEKGKLPKEQVFVDMSNDKEVEPMVNIKFPDGKSLIFWKKNLDDLIDILFEYSIVMEDN